MYQNADSEVDQKIVELGGDFVLRMAHGGGRSGGSGASKRDNGGREARAGLTWLRFESIRCDARVSGEGNDQHYSHATQITELSILREHLAGRIGAQTLRPNKMSNWTSG